MYPPGRTYMHTHIEVIDTFYDASSNTIVVRNTCIVYVNVSGWGCDTGAFKSEAMSSE